jgi:hypothetical protein
MMISIRDSNGIPAVALAIITITDLAGQARKQDFGKTSRPTCSSLASGEPMHVTADCIDPRFNDPYVDIDEQRTAPVPHLYVHGGFKGTDARFSFYFPPPEQYQGRFFQNTHQLLTSENGAPGTIGFAIASGAYYVQTNIGGAERATTTEQAVFGKLDPSVGGYRVNAERQSSRVSRPLKSTTFRCFAPRRGRRGRAVGDGDSNS